MRIALSAAALVLACASVLSAGRPPAQIPAEFTNLQVYPRDVSRAEFIGAMKAFTGALGVRCDHCHVGEDPDLSTFDFRSDDKPTKDVARRMLRMVATINAQLGVDGEAADPPKVTCFTCHRGSTRPLTEPGG